MGRSGVYAAAAANQPWVWRRLLDSIRYFGIAVRRSGRSGLSDTSLPDADAGAGRLCRRGPCMDRAYGDGRFPLSSVRCDPLFCGCPVRNGLRPDYHRCYHSGRGGGYAPQRPLLAQRNAVDGRHGRSGAVSGADPAYGRRGLLPDEGGKPRPYQVQAGAPRRRHRQDSLRHLCGADRRRDTPLPPWPPAASLSATPPSPPINQTPSHG